jgi:SAM-dependent methyltransferase
MSEWWNYENLDPVSKGQGWHQASSQGDHPDDNIDFHIDLGGGYLPKARLNIDRHEGADIQMDLDTGKIFAARGVPISGIGDTILGASGILPFPDESIESVITHHCLEHIGAGFVPLMDDVYRVLKKGGKFRIIVPMFPSFAMFESTDHKRFFGPESFIDFTGNDNDAHWHESFAEPYTKARFKQTAINYTPPTIATIKGSNFIITEPNGVPRESNVLTIDDLMTKAREMRVTLTK